MSLEHTHRYDDIVDLPHHRSRIHPAMPAAQRAAQFMPFAALTGYEEIIDDVARPRARRAELGEDAREELDRRLSALLARLDDMPHVEVTYFVAEHDGADVGEYRTVRGAVCGYDGAARRLSIDGSQDASIDARGDGRCEVSCADIVRIVVDA